ncbi:voltage-dependent anion channel-domain-containing protein [Bombardia bombarda]|uniref:Voltage-dependent anion channel-domain-containing protein n=1 Tax=Bombardia bombarda TaxID=252184 RepID=A0AA39WI51_9PEZI|nr:voltage-dependent anion channel-domain-containing protein [Bombardia bombarda]
MRHHLHLHSGPSSLFSSRSPSPSPPLNRNRTVDDDNDVDPEMATGAGPPTDTASHSQVGSRKHDDPASSSLNAILSKAANGTSTQRQQQKQQQPRHDHENRKVSIKDRIACYQWTWFTMTMATGGVANCLFSIPFKSQWLNGIGLAFFLLNICLFIINCILISLRFYWRPGSFFNSFTDQLECLFIPAFIVSYVLF